MAASRISCLLLLVDLKFNADTNPGSADPRDLEGDVKLSKLIPLKVFEENVDNLTACQIVEALPIGVTEYSNVVYLKLVCGESVAYYFM
jgi:hypothetical protein